jgi:outer membrane lipoprotein SlyB
MNLSLSQPKSPDSPENVGGNLPPVILKISQEMPGFSVDNPPKIDAESYLNSESVRPKDANRAIDGVVERSGVPGLNPATKNEVNRRELFSDEKIGKALSVILGTNSLVNPNAVGSSLEQLTAGAALRLEQQRLQIDQQLAALDRINRYYTEGFIDQSDYRLALAEQSMRLTELNAQIDVWRVKMGEANGRLGQKEIELQITELEAKAQAFKTRIDSAREVAGLNLQASGETRAAQVITTERGGELSARNVDAAVREQFLARKRSIDPTFNGRTLNGADNGAVIPPQAMGDYIEPNLENRQKLAEALFPATARSREQAAGGLPNDTKLGVGITTEQVREGGRGPSNNVQNSINDLGKLTDAQAKSQFGVGLQQAKQEIAVLRAGKPIHKDLGFTVPPPLERVLTDKQWDEAREYIVKKSKLPDEVKQFISALDNKQFRSMSASLGSWLLIDQIDKVGFGLGAFGGGVAGGLAGAPTVVGAIPGAAAGAVGGGTAGFAVGSMIEESLKKALEQFGVKTEGPAGAANSLGQFYRTSRYEVAANSLLVALARAGAAHENLYNTQELYKNTVEANLQTRFQTKEAFAAYERRIGDNNNLLQSLEQRGSKFDISVKNFQLNAEIYQFEKQQQAAQEAQAKLNLENARTGTKIATVGLEQDRYWANTQQVMAAMNSFNSERAGLIFKYGPGDEIYKTGHGLIITRKEVDDARKEVQGMVNDKAGSNPLLQPLDASTVSGNDPRVLNLAAAKAERAFSNLYGREAAMLNHNDGNNIVGRTAVALVRDGNIKPLKDYAPMKIDGNIPSTLPSVEGMNKNYTLVWSKPGGKSAPMTVEVRPNKYRVMDDVERVIPAELPRGTKETGVGQGL